MRNILLLENIFKDKRNLFFAEVFKDWGFNQETALLYNAIANVIVLLALLLLINKVLREIFVMITKSLRNNSDGLIQSFMVKNRIFRGVANLITLFLFSVFIPYALVSYPEASDLFKKIADGLTIVLVLFLLRSVLNFGKDYLQQLESFKDKPLESYVQIFLIFAWLVGFVLMFSLFTGKSIVTFLTALGALSAIILLLFKDTILGFVATIQVSANDMVRIGDWITMAKHGADGTVTEINLTSVKVRNFDNTISTIPTYYLTSEAFQNWRGMNESPGRRILRSINIRMNSVRFLTDEEIKELEKIQLLKDFIKKRQKEIDSHNITKGVDKSIPINGRHQTNLGLFRKYVNLYLEQNESINKDMLYIFRQQEPTADGIPMQIFAFSKEKEFIQYESVQAEIFDHIIAIVPYFGLEIFENVSGAVSYGPTFGHLPILRTAPKNSNLGKNPE